MRILKFPKITNFSLINKNCIAKTNLQKLQIDKELRLNRFVHNIAGTAAVIRGRGSGPPHRQLLPYNVHHFLTVWMSFETVREFAFLPALDEAADSNGYQRHHQQHDKHYSQRVHSSVICQAR